MYSQLLRHDKSSSGSGGAEPVRRWSTAASCWRRCQSIHPSTACCLLALSVAITLWAHQLEPNSAGARLRQMICAVDPELLSPLPSAFDPAYSSPCWRNSSSGRLACLPAFYVLSPHQAGGKSLYAALTGHPGVASQHDAQTQYWSGEHMTMEQYVQTFDASAQSVLDQPKLLIGDASEQTFTFYYAQNMKGHRLWSRVVPACFDACGRNHTDQASAGFVACAEGCWQQGGKLHAQQVRSVGLGQREDLTLPLLMRAAYGAAALPKLVVLLREPTERLHSAFWEYSQYRGRYGDTADGHRAFVEEQVGAYEQCVDRQAALAAAAAAGAAGAAGGRRAGGGAVGRGGAGVAERRCALLFESLGYQPEEKVFFHSDQVLRGLYAVFLQDWMALWPRSKILLIQSEDWFDAPQEQLARVTEFLGLSGGGGGADDALWQQMAAAERHRPSIASGKAPHPAATARADAFYAPFNRALGRMMGLGDVSPWEGRERPWKPKGSREAAAAAAGVGAAGAGVPKDKEGSRRPLQPQRQPQQQQQQQQQLRRQ